MQLLVKIVVSGLVIGLVTSIAQKQPSLGGWLASLPIITLTSVFWLVVGGMPNGQIARFLFGVLAGLVPTVLLIITMALALRRGVPLAAALGLGIVVWGSYTVLARWAGFFQG